MYHIDAFRPMSSEDEEFELDLEEDGDTEEAATGEPEDATEDGDEETNTDLSTTTDDDDDDDIDNSNDIDNELESQLQQELAMEVDAELEAEANELDAALLAEDPSVNASTSTQTTSTLDMREQGSHGRANELLPLPGPILDDHDHTGLGASPGRSRASSAPRGAGPSRQGSTSPPPALGIPSRRKKGSPSPASKRHAAVAAPVGLSTFTTKMPRTYQVEAICALPHPVPTHALACSYDMTHLLTGSDDGYIRDYDIFTAVNSKTFLSAPQRHHAGVVEGLMKAGQLRFWWENPGFNQRRGFIGGQAMPPLGPVIEEEPGLSPVYSLLMHSDALWALAGTDAGHINLFTVRHEPGKAMHVFTEHKSPVSAMSMDYGEKGFFSASWDGEAIQWDLNTGTVVRNFTAHNSQLTSIAVRPAYSGPYFDPTPTPVAYRRKGSASSKKATAPLPPNLNSNNQQLYQFSQDDVNMSPGNDNDTNSLFGDDEVDAKPSIMPPPGAMSVDPSSQTAGETTTQPVNPPAGEEDDAKSEGSVADSLFGDDGDDSESNANSNTNAAPTPNPTHQNLQPTSQNPYLSTLSVPPHVQPGASSSQYVTFPVGVQQQGQQPYFTQTFSVQLNPQQQQQQQPQQMVMQYSQAPPPMQAPQPLRSVAKIPAPKPPPKNAPPLLDSSGYSNFSSDLLMTAFVDGQVVMWDRRVSSPGKGVGRLWMSEKTPPWCLSACWSQDGGQIYAGRRNGTVDVWDVRLMGRHSMTGLPKLLKTLRNPTSSGVVSCVVPFPDCRHIASASIDNIRLWNVADAPGDDSSMAKPRGPAPFKIIPGHHGGYISQMLIDPGARFMVTASSNRGLHGDSTRTVFVHDVKLAY